MAGNLQETPKFGRRAVLAAASAGVAEAMLPKLGRTQEVQQYFVSEPNERGERQVQISLTRGQVALIGAEPWTTGTFEGANTIIGGACVPFAEAFAANTDITFSGKLTGEPHVEIIDFGSDVPFEDLPTYVNTVLRDAVKQINREQKDETHVGLPAVQVAGYIIGINRGRAQTDPAGRENRRRFVDEDFETAPAPAGCPAQVRATFEALPIPTAQPAPTAAPKAAEVAACADFPRAGQAYKSNRGDGSDTDRYRAVWTKDGRLWQDRLPPGNERDWHAVSITLPMRNAQGKLIQYQFNGVSAKLFVDNERNRRGSANPRVADHENGKVFTVNTSDGGEAWALVESDGGFSAGFEIKQINRTC